MTWERTKTIWNFFDRFGDLIDTRSAIELGGGNYFMASMLALALLCGAACIGLSSTYWKDDMEKHYAQLKVNEEVSKMVAAYKQEPLVFKVVPSKVPLIFKDNYTFRE